MNKKQVVVLSVILGILILGILLKAWVRSRDVSGESAQAAGVSLASLDPVKVERILIARGIKDQGVELIKENGAWKVKNLWGAKADSVKVEKLIQKLSSISGEFRGSGEKIFRDFGIGDADSFSIKFLGAQDALLLDLRLGTKRAGTDGCFMRKASGEDVYLVNLDLAELLGIYTDLEDATPSGSVWADLGLFDLDPGKVTKITIYRLKGDEKIPVLGLVRETDPKDPLKTSWKFVRKDMTLLPESDKVLKFIAILESMKAQKVVDPDGRDYGLEPPVWQLAVTEGNEKMLLNAGPKTGKDDLYYVKPSGGATVFGLKASFFNDLNVDDTHFSKDAPVAAAAAKNQLQGFDVDLPDGPGQTP